MEMGAYSFPVTDEAGNVLHGASIRVRLEAAGFPLVAIYADREGASPLGNPFVAADGTEVRFHAPGGLYRIDATKDGYTQTRRMRAIGTAQEYDVGSAEVPVVQAVDAGFGLTFESETSAPPSAGCIRFNNADLSLATEAYVSVSNLGGSSIELILLDLYSALRSRKDRFQISIPALDTIASLQVNSATPDGSPAAYITFGISLHDGETSFTDDSTVNFQKDRVGNDGASGSGTGDVSSSANIGDHRLVRGDGGLKGVQQSGITVDDSDNVTGVAAMGATTIELGHASDTTLARASSGRITVEGIPLDPDLPVTDRSAAHTFGTTDRNKITRHPAADNNPRTFTIDSNTNLALPVGTFITIINEINTVTIAITSDTLVLAGLGSTGSRLLAANGIATAVKVASTRWYISGVGLT
jgi:hypothetical protein